MICYITMYLYTIFAYSPCTQRNPDALEIFLFQFCPFPRFGQVCARVPKQGNIQDLLEAAD